MERDCDPRPGLNLTNSWQPRKMHRGFPEPSSHPELTPDFHCVIVTGLREVCLRHIPSRLCPDPLINLHEGMRVKVAFVRRAIMRFAR